MKQSTYSYLALGDSYTVGEGVAVFENFPYQAVKMLRSKGFDFYAAELLAKTGWTTAELQAGIYDSILRSKYSFVSLLIGVNNQSRGENIDGYTITFEPLLQQAIHFAGGINKHVIVLSIPDWSVTPFADGGDRTSIAAEINAYNAINKRIAAQYEVHYIDITPNSREVVENPDLLAADKLHPSGLAYSQWAAAVAAIIEKQIPALQS